MVFKRKRFNKKPNYRRFKRRFRRYKKRYRKGSLAFQRRTGFADSQVVKLKYAQYIQLDPGIGVCADHIFRANSLFDPNLTGVGHQPMAYDQWMTFYDHYTVLGAKITCKFISQTTTAEGVVVGILTTDNGTTIAGSDLTEIVEQGHFRYGVLTNGRARGALTLSKKFSSKRFFGVKDVMDNDRLQGSVGTNPSEGAFFHVVAGPASSTGDLAAIQVLVIIEYIAKLTEPKELAQS